jgi:hypothetical protein
MVEGLQEVWIGSTDGANDVGRLRIKSISSGDGGVTGTLTVAGHSHPLQDDQYLTFLHDYPLKPKYSYIDPATEIWYMDDDVTYSDQHTKPPPVVVAGPHRAGFLISGTATFNVDASASYTIAPGATKSSYALSVASTAGTPTVNFNTSTGLGDITFTAAGIYWAKYSVTDSNEKTQVSYRCYILHVADDPTSADAPWIDCEGVQLEADWENGGWTAGVKAHDNMALADIPDHTLCIIWHSPRYEGAIKHITFLPDDNPAVFVGYVREDSEVQQMGQGFGEVDLVLSTVEGRLREMFTFSTSLKAHKTAPDDWYLYEEWQTCGTIVHDLFLWRSTLLEMTDVIGLRDDTLNRMFQGFDEGNIFDNANNFLYSEGIRRKVLCDQGGRLHIVEDQQLMIDADRGTLTTSFPLIQTDAIADYGAAFAIQRRQEFEAPFVTANGIYWDGNTWDADDRPEANGEYCSIAPGGKPLWQGPDPQDFPKQTVSSQDHLNQICGRYEAKINNPVIEVVVEFHGMYNTILDIAYEEKHTISLQTTETPREIVWANKPLYIRHIQAIYEALGGGGGVWTVNASFEPENVTTDGVYTECPSFPLLGGSLPDPPTVEQPGALLTGASVNFKGASTDLWVQRLTQDVKDLIEDPYWRTKTASNSPDDAICFRCGVGYIKRSTDGFESVDVDVTPGTNPPNDAGDSPGPTATGVTYFMMEGSYPNQDEFAVLARWQNATSQWRSWIAYTINNGTSWSWSSLSAGGGGAPTFGTTENIGSAEYLYMSGSTPQSAHRAVASLTSTKVVLQRVNDGAAEDHEVCVADISGDSITEGSYYNVEATPSGATPINSKIVGMDSDTFLVAQNRLAVMVRAGNVSGTTISFGSEQLPGFTGTIRDIGACRLSDTVAVVGATKVGTPITFWVATVTGNSVSLGSAQTYGTDSGRFYLALAPLSSTKFAAFYTKNVGPDAYVRIGTVSGSTISFGSEYQVSENLSNSSGDLAITALDDTTVVMAWEESTGSLRYKYLKAGTISGTVVTLGSTVEYWASTNSHTTAWSSLDAVDSSAFILMFKIDGNGNRDYLEIGSVSGTTITLDPGGPYDNGESESSEGCVLYLGGGRAIAYKALSSASQCYAYMINGLSASYEVRALGLSLGKTSGATAWGTVVSDDGIELLEMALPALTVTDSYELGSSTIAQAVSQTYLAYPFVPFGYEDAVYIYGRMNNPQSLGDPAHIIRTTDGGSSFGLIEDGWGADHCSALALHLDNTLYTIRNATDRAKLYIDNADNVLLLKLTLPFFAQVAPHGMLLDYYTQDVYACAWTADVWMVAKIAPPYLAASNLTFDHDATEGIESIIML